MDRQEVAIITQIPEKLGPEGGEMNTAHSQHKGITGGQFGRRGW